MRAGEAFQVVPPSASRRRARRARWTCTGCCGPPTRPRIRNLLRLDGFDVVGSSPEALVKVEDGRAMVHPIAGTRPAAPPRRRTRPSPTSSLADPKERAEHLMCSSTSAATTWDGSAEPGSVEVVDFMSVERYSHVMHIVSTVTGRVAPDRTAFDVLTACFPAGTPPARPSRAPCRSSTNSNRPGAACTAAASATSTSRATRHRHRHPHRAAARRHRLRAGRRRCRRRPDPVAEDTECRNKAAAVLRAVHTANRLGR
ncbi:chorismate-binding protein [Streptomyces thinghirensis]|nr:chorismate-binding protein [Streptomyces thinghirensis]